MLSSRRQKERIMSHGCYCARVLSMCVYVWDKCCVFLNKLLLFFVNVGGHNLCDTYIHS